MPKGIRTVGVLTKPDTIEERCHVPWIRILKNESHRLHHGYFIVKNPTKVELEENISFKQARKNEAAFFNDEPWTEVKKDRMGINKLKSFISSLLIKKLEECVPTLYRKIEVMLSDIDDKLRGLHVCF